MSFKNVYVSHSAAQDIGPVRRLIEEEGATVLGSYDISSPKEISTVLNRDIESAKLLRLTLNRAVHVDEHEQP
jgi:hypothetical protein